MWKRADDPKSNAILVTLAYVDFIRPKWAIFENVRGFLQFNLKAKQAGPHRLEGGMKMGGIKFLESALIRMGRVSVYVALPGSLIFFTASPGIKFKSLSCSLAITGLLRAEFDSFSSQPRLATRFPRYRSPHTTSRRTML
jgi:hypothetical protein